MKENSIYQYIYILYSSVLIINFILILMGYSEIDLGISILAIVMLVIAFFKASVLFKVLGCVFVIIGSLLYMTTSVPFLDVIKVFKENLPLLTLFMLLSWMNSIVRSGRYDYLLSKIMKLNTKDIGVLYNRTSLATFSLATFLNMPAITISQDIIKSNLQMVSKRMRNRFINMASVRSYAMALLWSPLEVIVAVGIFVTDIKYIQVFPWLILTVIIVFLIDNLFGRMSFRKHPYTKTSSSKSFTRYEVMKFYYLIGALTIFLLLITVAGSFNKYDFITIITLLIVPFSFLWAIFIKRLKRFWIIGWNTWKASVNGMNNFIVLFISLSLFSGSISDSFVASHIHNFILSFSEYPLLLMVCIQMFILLMTLFGVHPIATIGILSGTIGSLMEIINPISLAIILIISSVSTLAVSTYGILVTITSFNTEQNPYRITLDNMVFTLISGTVGTIIAYLLMI